MAPVDMGSGSVAEPRHKKWFTGFNHFKYPRRGMKVSKKIPNTYDITARNIKETSTVCW